MSTHPFKAGDRVRVIYSTLLGNGTEHVVREAYTSLGTPCVRLVGRSVTDSHYASRFELVAPAMKTGDLVRVVRKVTERVAGSFENCWTGNMDAYVNNGVTYEVSDIAASGIHLKGTFYRFPPSALELAAPPSAEAADKIDLSSLNVGDKVTMTVTVEVTGEADWAGDIPVKTVSTNDCDGAYLYDGHSYTGTVERAPQPLKVGDEVRTLSGTKGTIKAIEDGKAWVRLSNGGNTVLDLDNLKRA